MEAVTDLDVIAGNGPADPLTLTAIGRTAPHTALSAADGLDGARIGVVRAISDTETADPEILALFEQAPAEQHLPCTDLYTDPRRPRASRR
jgi:Asp-tRNA(Asn)/Glu-tRNA(Gln) amidotransferase A subunit family amidase